MAAGLVSHNITTSAGVTFAVKSWVPDTSAPDVGAIPVHISFDSTGAEVWTAANSTSLLGYVDGIEGKLDTLHTDLATTIAGYVDGLEALVGTTNTGNATLHTDIGSTNTKLDTLHADLTGTQLVALDTAKIANAGALLTPKFAPISCSSSGVNIIVAAVTSKKIRVLGWDLMPNAAVNAKWQSHTTPTDLTGLYYMAGQGNGVARAFNPVGYFESLSGQSLDLNLSSAVAVGGSLVYVEV